MIFSNKKDDKKLVFLVRDAGHVLPVSDFNQNRFDRFIFEGDILAPAGNTQSPLELQTKVREDFTITEKGEGPY